MSQTTQVLVNTYEASPDAQRFVHQLSTNLQGQRPPRLHSKGDLLRRHYENLSLREGSSGANAAKQVVLPSAYSPSVSPLETLQKVSLEDLKLETHHRGYFLTATTITAPYESTDTITVIQEETGEVAVLVLGFQDQSDQVAGSSLPQNSTVAIKEPYVQFNEESNYVIRVDHPSDIAVLRGDDPAVSMIMKFVAEKKAVSPLEWKKAGDEAYLERKYFSAIECYTQAIDNGPQNDQNFIRDTYMKRAYANLISERFQNAKDDALASCSGGEQDARSYYTAGKAAYALREYSTSKEYFEKALRVGPNDLRCGKDLLEALARIDEEQNGIYDFEKMSLSVTEQHIYLDHADYSAETEIGNTEHAGRGLFATQDIPAGGLVLCEKAFSLPDVYTGDEPNDMVLYNLNNNSRTQRPAQTALFLQLVQKLYNNPHLAPSYFDLDGGKYIRAGKEGTLVDGVPVVDTFLVEAIRIRNCFSSPRLSRNLMKRNHTPSEGALSTGLWRKASYINHSCAPNCARSFIGDMMIIRAISPIAKGTEITQQYATPDASFTFRRDLFPANWEFSCSCRLCEGEQASPDAMHIKRRDLANKIKSEALRTPSSSRISSATIKHVERLTKKLEDLYEPKIYSTLPRLLLVHPNIWLTDAYRTLKNPSKTAKYALEVVRNFGFIDPIRNGKLVLDTEGVANAETCNALKYAMEGFEQMGKMDMAAQCEGAARRMYAVLTGCSVGVEEYLNFDRVDVGAQVGEMVSAIESLGFYG